MQSQKSVEIQRLRGTILSDAESPIQRLAAARRLLSRYGPSERNVPVIRRVIKLFESDGNGEISERCLKLKAQLLKRLDLKEIASVPLDDADDQPEETSDAIAEPSESAPTYQASTESDDEFAVPYPPQHLLFPPPESVYKVGWLDSTLVAQRLLAGGARSLSPAPSRPDVCEQIIKLALGPNYAYAEITFDMLQRLWFGLQGLEPRMEDPRMVGHRHRFWLFEKLLGAVFYLSNAKFGFGALCDPPPDPEFARRVIADAPRSAYARLEQIPRLRKTLQHYRHLPGFEGLLKEFQAYEVTNK